MEMVAFFAATALLLAGLGIYGTISYVVNEQRREIAIRLALGAQRGNILKMVLRRGLGLAAAGAGLGVAGALIVSHLMAGLLFGVSPDRSAHLRWCDPCAYHCRARRQLYPGAARHARRSHRCFARGLNLCPSRQTMSGSKLAPMRPLMLFFKKNGDGAIVPIAQR